MSWPFFFSGTQGVGRRETPETPETPDPAPAIQ